MNWISVNHRMPEDGQEVLTYNGSNYELAEYRSYEHDGMWFDTYGGDSIDTPTHWCELIEPLDNRQKAIIESMNEKINRMQLGTTYNITQEETPFFQIAEDTIAKVARYHGVNFTSDPFKGTLSLESSES